MGTYKAVKSGTFIERNLYIFLEINNGGGKKRKTTTYKYINRPLLFRV